VGISGEGGRVNEVIDVDGLVRTWDRPPIAGTRPWKSLFSLDDYKQARTRLRARSIAVAYDPMSLTLSWARCPSS